MQQFSTVSLAVSSRGSSDVLQKVKTSLHYPPKSGYVEEASFVNDSAVLTNISPWFLFFRGFIIMKLTFLF